MPREHWTPIAADPSPSSAARRRERTERIARTLTAKAEPCDQCGGGKPHTAAPDKCGCGTVDDTWAVARRLIDRCERNACEAEARNARR